MSKCDDERVALANLIANLKLDVDENKKIQKQLKKANATLTQELTECKSILAETSRTLGESNSIRDSCLVALQNKQTEFERYKAFNDRTVDYDKLERKLNETLGLLAQKEIDIKEGLKVKAYEISVVKEKHDELVKQSLLTKSHYEGLVKEKTKLKKLIEKCKGKSVNTKFDKPSVVRQPNAQRIPKPSVLGKPAPFLDSLERTNFAKKKSVSKTNESEVLSKPVTPQNLPQTATQAIVQLILFIVDSGCTKHMTGNLSLLCNFVEKYLGTVHFNNDQFALILGYGDLVQGNITINRVYYVEGLNHNLFSGNDLLTGNRGTDLYTISLQETTSSTPICLMAKASPTQAWLWHQRLSHLNFDYINLLSKKDVVIGLPKLKYVKDQLCSSCESKGYRVYNKRTRLIVKYHLSSRFDEYQEMYETSVANDTSGLVPQRQKASDYDNPDPAPQLQNISPSADTTVFHRNRLDLLFVLCTYEIFNDVPSRVDNFIFCPPDNSIQKDTLPSMHIQPPS
ncbi:retrovirus-related pol polyprotein from transposon TNT 1-94 [Tanacetum coccineum]